MKVDNLLQTLSIMVGISVEFEDSLLSSYNKYRYKFSIERNIWGQDNFDVFKAKLFEG